MNPPNSPSWSIAAVQLVEAACRARDGDAVAAEAYIARALAHLNDKPVMASATPPPPQAAAHERRGRVFESWQVRCIVSYIDSHLTARIRIGELADLVELSTFHFCRVFKLTFGLPTQVWILHRRIEAAQGLMLTTCDNLAEIALRCGMSDQSHFTRTFHRLIGETPNHWRRSRRGAMLDCTLSMSASAESGPAPRASKASARPAQ